MIIIKKITEKIQEDKLTLNSMLDIDGKSFNLHVNILGKQWHKYAVADRADAFLFGVLPYAMRHGHDIKCESPVSGTLLFNLTNQYIPTLSKHDENLYNSVIVADSIDREIECEGAVATGLSCGVDCLHTVIENYKYKISKKLELTHFCVFNQGAFGGSFYSTNRDFAVKKIYAKEKALADELGLPIINLETNLESLIKIPVDKFVVYAMGIQIMSISKLIGTYLYSSSGDDYSGFSVKDTSKKDISYADILTLHCISHGPTYFYSAGGAKTRFEKFKAFADNKLVKKHLFSCLTQTFNCGVCPKCYRNLLTIDALGKLDDFKEVYDIENYRMNRLSALEYLVREIVFHGYSYSYLFDVYTAIKQREPDLIKSIEDNISINKLIAERDNLRDFAEQRQRVLRAYKTLLSDSEMKKLKTWFESKNIKSVILYSYSYCTDIIVALQEKIGIEVKYIVEDVDGVRKIPRLPYNTVEYPNCDAIIMCDMKNPKMSTRKLKERTNIPVVLPGEFLDLRPSL